MRCVKSETGAAYLQRKQSLYQMNYLSVSISTSCGKQSYYFWYVIHILYFILCLFGVQWNIRYPDGSIAIHRNHNCCLWDMILHREYNHKCDSWLRASLLSSILSFQKIKVVIQINEKKNLHVGWWVGKHESSMKQIFFYYLFQSKQS